MVRDYLIALLAFSLAAVASAAVLDVVSVRALDTNARTSVMVQVKNTSADAVTIRDLLIAGEPIAAQLALSDPKNPRSVGKGVDWYDIRPRTIPAGEAGTIVLGYMARELREPKLLLHAVTDYGEVDLTCPAPQPDALRVACAAFAPDLKRVTVFLRNTHTAPVAITRMTFNGKVVAPRLQGSPIPPGLLAVATFVVPMPVTLAADCVLHVSGTGASTTAWFRAFPAESLTYPFYGQHCDPRDLAEKHMDVYVTRRESSAQGLAEECDRHGGVLPAALAARVARNAEVFGNTPDAWAWYMQDDAGWGRPRPQSLITVGDYLRSHGSRQQQFLCNPADNQRYAWTSDIYMNYAYHVTHQWQEPTIFLGGRSLNLMRQLNEPAPVLYLVDSVGQSVRWITMAEEELASYAMLGRGARHLGWFLIPSVWDQGTDRYGGIDMLEDKPMRYQEGATACVPIWNHIGKIAGVFKALQPYLAASATLPGELRQDRIEVLPLLCKDDLLLTTLLNRTQRCSYPRDYPTGESSGGVKLYPFRDTTISQVLPAWITPAKVLLFDHDRGVREAPFRVEKSRVTVRVDALDTSALLLICPTEQLAETLKTSFTAWVRPVKGGSAIRPDVVQTAGHAPAAAWAYPAAGYRAALIVKGPVPAGAWVVAALPVEAGATGPLGYLSPQSVAVTMKGTPVPCKVDYSTPVYSPVEGAVPWSVRKDDPQVAMTADAAGVTVTATYGRGSYGTLGLIRKLDPRYDILEIRRSVSETIQPLLSYQRTVKGKTVGGSLNFNTQLTSDAWPTSQVLEMPGSDLGLARIHWQRLVRQYEQDLHARTSGEGDANWQPTQAGISAQIYTGTYQFGEIRQCKSAPDLYVQLPTAVKDGETLTLYAYWDYARNPGVDSPVLKTIPQEAVRATVGEREGFRVASVNARVTAQAVESLALTSQAQAASAWVEARDNEGTLLAVRNLAGANGLQWALPARLPLPTSAEQVTVYVAGAGGHVVAVPLRTPAPLPALTPLTRVSGQVETLACPADGSWVLAGADKVYAVSHTGATLWTVDLGEHRRQTERYGPGRNIEQVAVRPDGRAAFSRTFRWEANTRQFTPSFLVPLTPTGEQARRVDCDWQSGARFTNAGSISAVQVRNNRPVAVFVDPATGTVTDAPAAAPAKPSGYQITTRAVPGKPRVPILALDGKEVHEIDWPPYTKERFVLKDGRIVVTTTQGLVQVIGVDGTVTWSQRRNSRIDAAVVPEGKGVVVIAYKTYPHRWDWWSIPRLEVLSLADGTTQRCLEGVGADDFGHLGTDLQLAASTTGDRIYLGAPDGRIYLYARGM
jgi:hypothetical protein